MHYVKYLPSSSGPSVILILILEIQRVATTLAIRLTEQLLLIQADGAPKVGQLTNEVVGDDDIRWLDVHVNDIVQVAELDRLDQIEAHRFSLGDTESTRVIKQELAQIHGTAQLIDDKGVLGEEVAFIEAEMLYNIRML